MELYERLCPICCQNTNQRVYSESNIDYDRLDGFAFASRKLPEYMHHRLMECGNCDLVYASPAPRGNELTKAYENASYDSGEEAKFASLTYASYLKRISQNMGRNGAIDIGAGDGAFLERLLEMGFENVIGIEPSSAPIKSALPNIAQHIIQDIFPCDSIRDAKVSLISCFQTIEHVPDPLSTSKSAYDNLSNGGAFFIVGHNRRALSCKVMGEKSPIFDIEHLQLFSSKSLRLLLETAGFRNITVFPVVNKYPLHYLIKLAPMPASIKAKLLKSAQNSVIGKIPITLPLGNIGAIGYK